MTGTIFVGGLCFIVVAATIAGLLPQLAPGIGDSTLYAVALTVGALCALAMALIVSQDEGANR